MKRGIVVLALAASIMLAACQKKTTPDDVVNKMVQTQGGAEKMAAIQDQVSQWDSKVTMTMGDSTVTETASMTIMAKRPNKLKFEVKNPNGVVGYISVFDGTNGWVYGHAPDGTVNVMDMTPEQMQEASNMAETWLDGWHNYAAKGIKLAMLPDTALDGKAYHVVQATDKFGNVSKNYCDTQTGMIERTECQAPGPMTGAREPSVMKLTNYSSHDGFMMAQNYWQSYEQSKMIAEATLKEVKHNTGVADEVFAKPEPPPMSAEHPQEHPSNNK